MSRKICILVFFTGFLLKGYHAYSWGLEGHRIIVRIAKSQLPKEIIDSVQFYLGDLTWEDAACWMDKCRADPKFDYMIPWHSITISKDKTYVKKKEQNIVNQFEVVFMMLHNRRLMGREKVNNTLKLLFHLIGDIHQPLHCGYPEDREGNEVAIEFFNKKTNLHRVWDSEMIEKKGISMWTCVKTMMSLTRDQKREIKISSPVEWVKEARILLPGIYDIKNGKIEQAYMDRNAQVLEYQLVKAGLRLASILNIVF